jgi:lipopolysaccharide transport system permease protein
MSVVEKPFRNHVIKPRSSFAINWQELWQYRELLYFFAWKEVKVRYKQAVLGVAWTLLQSLAMMVVFIVLLHRGLGVSTGEIPPPIVLSFRVDHMESFQSCGDQCSGVDGVQCPYH